MAQREKIGTLQVFQRMSDENEPSLRLAPMANIVSVYYNHKRGTDVTFGVEGNLAFKIERGELVGGFIFCDRKRFMEVLEQLKAEASREP